MGRPTGYFGAALLALALAGTPIELHAASARSDKAAIEALEQRFSDALNARDLDAIMKVYAPGATLHVFDVSPPREHLGWDAYKKDWQELFNLFPGPVKFLLVDLEIGTAGTLAYSHSIQDAIFTNKDGTKTHIVVRVTDVYRKIKGHWLIVHEHVSIPVDLETMKPDPLSKP